HFIICHKYTTFLYNTAHYTTCCAIVNNFICLRVRNSCATAPKIREPKGLCLWSINTTAFERKDTDIPLRLCVRRRARTRIPIRTSCALIFLSGITRLIATTKRSPNRACPPALPNILIHAASSAPVLSVINNLVPTHTMLIRKNNKWQRKSVLNFLYQSLYSASI